MTFQMHLNPWIGCERYVKCERALKLNGCQVLFQYRHGKHCYLGDRVLPQVEHVYPPTTIPTPPCHTVRLANFLADKEIAQAHDDYIVAGVEGNNSEFVRDYLQGRLVGRTIFLFPFKIKFLSANSFSIFLLGNNICTLDFQPPPSEGEEGGEEEKEIPSPHHASSSSSSIMWTYPHFPARQYDVMNPDGTYSSMPLTRPEHVPNVPWPDLVCS